MRWALLLPLAACLATACAGLALALRDPGHVPAAPLVARGEAPGLAARPAFDVLQAGPPEDAPAPAALDAPAAPGPHDTAGVTLLPEAAELHLTQDARPEPVVRAARPGRHADIAARLGWKGDDPRTLALQRWLSAPGERRGADLVALFGRTDAEAIARDVPLTASDPRTGALIAVDLDGLPVAASDTDASPGR